MSSVTLSQKKKLSNPPGKVVMSMCKIQSFFLPNPRHTMICRFRTCKTKENEKEQGEKHAREGLPKSKRLPSLKTASPLISVSATKSMNAYLCLSVYNPMSSNHSSCDCCEFSTSCPSSRRQPSCRLQSFCHYRCTHSRGPSLEPQPWEAEEQEVCAGYHPVC